MKKKTFHSPAPAQFWRNSRIPLADLLPRCEYATKNSFPTIYVSAARVKSIKVLKRHRPQCRNRPKNRLQFNRICRSSRIRARYRRTGGNPSRRRRPAPPCRERRNTAPPAVAAQSQQSCRPEIDERREERHGSPPDTGSGHYAGSWFPDAIRRIAG